jgi:NAD(P)-dependent dehydrogenase (short-subunit alcohol dehydrogenase family)
MARVLITGSTDGLGLLSARALAGQGHEVVLHARSAARARDLDGIRERAVGVVVGDLADHGETRAAAEQANEFGPLDAVIHNAGVYLSRDRATTSDGHARTLAVNVLAPYLLTALIPPPRRLVYMSSGMHRGAAPDLGDLDWTRRRWNASQAYSESKLAVSALAAAVAQRRPEVLSNSVDPGWVPTRMGGAGAPDDLEAGHRTQDWLAVSDDPEAQVSGRYWHHRRQARPAPAVVDPAFQDDLLDLLAGMTGVALS